MITSSFFSNQFTISKPHQSVDCFSHTLSTFQFVLDHRVSSTHTSDLLGINSIAVRACVCEKGFEVVCVRLLNQYLLHPFQLWDLASSVYLSPSPQPSQNAYIDAQAWLHSLGKKEFLQQTPRAWRNIPVHVNPHWQLNPRHTLTADCKNVLEFFILSAVMENTMSHTQYHCVYICVSNYSLYDSAGFLCPSVYVYVCVDGDTGLHPDFRSIINLSRYKPSNQTGPPSPQ